MSRPRGRKSKPWVEPRRRPPVDVRALTGGELLRLLLERILGHREMAVCQECGGGVSFSGSMPDWWRCIYCEGILRHVDQGAWEQMAHRVRGALRRDRTLLSRIKADFEDVRRSADLPPLPQPFSWLADYWRKAKRPRGRPFYPAWHLQLAYDVGDLQREGISLSEITNILKQPGDRRFLNPEEIWRSNQWATRYYTQPMARLRGERVRSRQRK